ncbi:pyruvate dehydrogenase (quinone) [Bryocella elongata]|uniref:Pyruvate dehydrogenase (Quinone) n=1 Tax=Bryocella elongata TaxID=863522 RepID=A0A1H5XWI7_9BACT|nr:ubiquinone-dependent pyruvate dehydrogenase [Bryocella elongata]SEG16159.1 pyruvate dehydrogenase (quinone) [Bryocella elongata]
MANVADVLIDTLIANGVERIWGLPGDSLNGVTDAMRTRPEIAWLHVRNEEAAAFAAGAEAHVSGKLAVCAGSCGPGNLHLINGLFDCQRSRVPVLAIAAQIPSSEMGTNYFQETRPEELFKDCSVYTAVVTEPGQLERVLPIAMRAAISQRGVAVLVIPGNIASMHSSWEARSIGLLENDSEIVPSKSALQRAAEILNSTEKVAILAGAGCIGAHAELLAFAEALQSPITHALRGKEFVEYDNPYDVGMTGLLGFSSGYAAMEGSEALVILGSDFPYSAFFPKHAKVIQVDSRGEQIGRRTHVDVALIGTVKGTIDALLPLLNKGRSSAYLEKAQKHYVKARQGLNDLATADTGDGPLRPEFVTQVLDDLASDDAVFTCDVGTPTVWAARYLTMNGKRRLIGSFNHGSMACALPQALGAQGLDRKRQVISMSGDGGLAMLMGELLTAKQNKLPVKVVVFNNGALAFVELEMKAAGYVNFGTDLDDPNFTQLATSCGFLARKVTRAEDLHEAVREMLAHDGPALLDVAVQRQELSMPPTITLEQAKGFGLYLLRAVLTGRGDEVLDLAETNLLTRLL